MDKLNELEIVIVNGEDEVEAIQDEVEAAHWAQAEEVVRRMVTEKQKDIAATWTNGRTGQKYSVSYVKQHAAIWKRYGAVIPDNRPSWADAWGQQGKGSAGQPAPPPTARTLRGALGRAIRAIEQADAALQQELRQDIPLWIDRLNRLSLDAKTETKIKKLQALADDPGATEAEAANAKERIRHLRAVS